MTLSIAAVAGPRRPRGDSFFFGGMALAMAVTVVVGFAPTFYLRAWTPGTDALPRYLQIHGVAFTAWILLFGVQAALVANGHTRRHRMLGWAGAGLAATMIASGTTSGILSMRRAFAAGYEDEAAAFLLTPFSAMLVFSVLVAAAIVWRRRPDTHKRLMLLASISLLDAAIARWPVPFTADWMFLAATDVFILAGAIYDGAVRGRLSLAYLAGATLIVVGQILRLVAGSTDAWRAVARQILQ